MTKRIGIVVAAFVAVAVVFAGARTFACGDECKTGAKTASVKTAGGSCCPTDGAKAQLTSGDACSVNKSTSETGSRGSCSSKSKNSMLTSGSCSSKDASMASGSSCSSKNSSMASGSSCSSKNASMASGSSCSSKGGAQTASSGSCATKNSNAQMTSSGCSSKGASAEMTSAGCATKHAKADMASSSCGSHTSKASYAANVYEVRDGKMWAVCNGQKFEVTESTPYTEVGTARYYFADEASRVHCAEKMANMAHDLDKEAVSLATAEANVTVDDGQKYGICPVTNDKFLVTASSPAKVIDGQKHYVCSDKCASQMIHTADQQSTH